MVERSGKTIQTQISLPEDLRIVLVKLALSQTRSLSNLITVLLRDHPKIKEAAKSGKKKSRR